MNTGLLLTMVSCGVITAVGTKVCGILGETDIAQYVKVGGVSLTGIIAIGIVIQLISTVKKLFGV